MALCLCLKTVLASQHFAMCLQVKLESGQLIPNALLKYQLTAIPCSGNTDTRLASIPVQQLACIAHKQVRSSSPQHSATLCNQALAEGCGMRAALMRAALLLAWAQILHLCCCSAEQYPLAYAKGWCVLLQVVCCQQGMPPSGMPTS